MTASAAPHADAAPVHPLAFLFTSSLTSSLGTRWSDPTREPPWLLLEGDVKAGLSALAPESVDCVVTSPPYFWQRDYGVKGQIGHEPSIQGYVEALRDAFRPLRRVLKKHGTLFLNLGDTYYSAKGRPHGKDDKHKGRMLARKQLRAVDGPGLGLPRKSLIGIPWRVAIALQDDGWTLRSDIVWKRPGTMPEPTAQDRPWNTHEHVFLFTSSPRYHFDRRGLQGEEDIWHISARPDNPGAHFAPFPAALAERCIRCGCKPGGIVLDPFAGSGMTLLVAGELGHPSVGIELSGSYCESIAHRLGNAKAPLEARKSATKRPPERAAGQHDWILDAEQLPRAPRLAHAAAADAPLEREDPRL